MDSCKRVRHLSLNSASSSSSNCASPPPSSPVDRFIPRRRSIDTNVQAFFLSESDQQENVNAASGPTVHNTNAEFNEALRSALLSSPTSPKPSALSSHSENFGTPTRRSSNEPRSPTGRAGPRVLNFSDATPCEEPKSPLAVHNMPGNSVAASPDRSKARLTRSIPSAPTRILDAPDIVSCRNLHSTDVCRSFQLTYRILSYTAVCLDRRLLLESAFVVLEQRACSRAGPFRLLVER